MYLALEQMQSILNRIFIGLPPGPNENLLPNARIVEKSFSGDIVQKNELEPGLRQTTKSPGVLR